MRALFGAWSRLRKDHPDARLIVAARDIDPGLRQACRSLEGDVELLHDPGGKTAARFNAKWSARAYALDPEGGLEYVQHEATPDTEAMLQVARLWQKGEAAP